MVGGLHLQYFANELNSSQGPRCAGGLRQSQAQQHEIGAAVAELSKHQLGLAVLSESRNLGAVVAILVL